MTEEAIKEMIKDRKTMYEAQERCLKKAAPMICQVKHATEKMNESDLMATIAIAISNWCEKNNEVVDDVLDSIVTKLYNVKDLM